MSQKLEYDAQLGGSVVLDDHVPTYRYAASVLQEVRQLLNDVSQPVAGGGGKLIFQTLPKHLRRRAMSHNPKRLPRKYRRIHIAQMEKSGGQRVTKRPSRKYRRRPRYLMQDYLRRQRRNAWLETHIWHAKRFHMIDRWGYRLPHYSCDKMFRACYRAGAEHCLVQDISYYACFELQATVSCIYEGFCRLSNKALTTGGGLSIKANTFISGQREGALDLFLDGQYPAGALCRAMFMWRPVDEQSLGKTQKDEPMRTFWLWVHACVYEATLKELIKVFGVNECMAVDEAAVVEAAEVTTVEEVDEKPTTSKKAKAASKQQQFRSETTTKSAALTRGKIYSNTANDVTLTDLKQAMNRFRLTGPLSQSVLTRALKTKNLPTSQVDAAPDWYQQHSTDNPHFQTQHNAQAEFWAKCKSLDTPAHLLPNFVLGLNVIDPRLKRPWKRTKARPEKPDSSTDLAEPLELLVDLPKCLSNSVIWDADMRENVRLNMMDTHTWCQMREKHALVPGNDLAFEEQMQAMPLLLIQRPGLQERNMRLNYGCGWDIIVPAGYGLLVWLTLIMWGAKPGGLRESDTLAREMGSELHLPDTVGGVQLEDIAYKERRQKYFKLPQGKRSNYNKLAIVSPFRVPWSQLVRDWLTSNETPQGTVSASQASFYVLRERLLLTNLNAMLQRNAPTMDMSLLADSAVIQLRLRMSTRGNIGVNALICLPTHIDVKKKLKGRRNSNNDPIHLEPTPPDLNQKERKVLRQQHKKQLKRLRRQRYREKQKQQETSTKRVVIRAANTAPLVADHTVQMQKLWLPNETCETLYSVRKQCSRETVGYVTTAGFSYTVGTVCAVGYVTANGLKALISMQKKLLLPQPLCLLRDINSPQYYFATFDVPINP